MTEEKREYEGPDQIDAILEKFGKIVRMRYLSEADRIRLLNKMMEEELKKLIN